MHLYSTQWTAPKWESVDPLKDAKAELQQIRSGTLTLPSAIAQNGFDPQSQLKEIAALNKLLDSLKIILDSDPRNTNIRGVEQPADSGEVAPDQTPGKPGKAKSHPPVTQAAEEHGFSFADRRQWDSLSRIYR